MCEFCAQHGDGNFLADGGVVAQVGNQRFHAVDGRADPLVAIEERELLEHAQVRELDAEQADRQRPRPGRPAPCTSTSRSASRSSPTPASRP